MKKKTKQNKACVDSLHSEYRTVHCPKKALHLELERERERTKSNWRFDVCLQKIHERIYCQKKETVTSQKLKVNVS